VEAKPISRYGVPSVVAAAIAVHQDSATSRDWPVAIYRTLKEFGVAQTCYVPDAGHSRLIKLAHADTAIKTTVLTTEEEGVALAAGAWLGGDRAVLLTSRAASAIASTCCR